MNKFVSQKTRLIPILFEGGARTHRRAHQPKELYPHRLKPGADLFPKKQWSEHLTNRDTKELSRYIQRAIHLPWESSWNLHVPDGRRPLFETAFASPAGSRRAFG